MSSAHPSQRYSLLQRINLQSSAGAVKRAVTWLHKLTEIEVQAAFYFFVIAYRDTTHILYN